jgi:hypothetical protein
MTWQRFFRYLELVFTAVLISQTGLLKAQSPEISLREFASGQIKKGVRSIGMGGDGASWGNYSLIWRDTATALIDAGITHYTNGNNFSFTAVGATTPSLWHRLAVYAIALSQYASNIKTTLKSPGLGPSPVPVHGNGNNQAVFVKAALPFGKGFSAGILLSYERSQFNATPDAGPQQFVSYHTNWRPSGGLGLSWQPNKLFLFGFRALLNHDEEVRTDNKGTAEGLVLSHEYRLGGSAVLWKGALLDIGGNVRYRYNEISNSSQTNIEPNIGFEQSLFNRLLTLRAGVDETSPTVGITLRSKKIWMDVAYIYNMASVRLAGLFGTTSNSIIATLVFSFSK